MEGLFHLESLAISVLMTLLKVDPSLALMASQNSNCLIASNIDLMASCHTIQSPPKSDSDSKYWLTNKLHDSMRHTCTYFLTTTVMIPAPSYLPPFNSSAFHNGMCELSDILAGPKWLDFYIRLIPTKTASLQFLKYQFT